MRDYALLPRNLKTLLRGSVGRYVVAEQWWKIRFFPQRAMAKRAENREVFRLKKEFPYLPSARVAVIVPTYRRPESLREAVLSILAQSEEDFVILVVDDGGKQTDTLPDDPKVIRIALSRNYQSPGLARNVALRLSQSAFVAFLDDDNAWRENHLECALGALDGGHDLVYTTLRRVRADGSELDVLSRDFDRKAHRDDSWVDINSVVATKTPGLRFSPWARPRWVHPREDWEFVHRVSARLKVKHVPTITVDYRVHTDSYFTEWEAEAVSNTLQEKVERSRE